MASAINIVLSNASGVTSGIASRTANAQTANAHASNAQRASDAASNPGASTAQDNDFMQLMTAILSGNAAPTATESTSSSSAADNSKDDKQSERNDVAPQWLLSPLAAQASPATQLATTEDVDAGDETIDALTPANNAGTNALLAQSLKRLGNDKNELSSSTTNKATDDNAVPTFLSSKQDLSPLDMMLNSASAKTPTELPGTDKIKDTQSSAVNDNAASSLQAMNSLQTSVTNADNAAGAPQYKIHSRVGSHEWVNEVGNRLLLMNSHKVQSASLQLNPDNLGPVQVKIEVNNNQANVWFTADQADTRTALEQSLPRLRELFAAQGMSLMDAGVFGQQARQQQAPSFSGNSQPSLGMTDMSNEATMTQQVLKIGLLDTYA